MCNSGYFLYGRPKKPGSGAAGDQETNNRCAIFVEVIAWHIEKAATKIGGYILYSPNITKGSDIIPSRTKNNPAVSSTPPPRGLFRRYPHRYGWWPCAFSCYPNVPGVLGGKSQKINSGGMILGNRKTTRFHLLSCLWHTPCGETPSVHFKNNIQKQSLRRCCFAQNM